MSSTSQGATLTNRFLGILKHVGRDVDVGKYRQEPANQAQSPMAGGRHEVKHPHMGHRRVVRPEKGSRFMQAKQDYG